VNVELERFLKLASVNTKETHGNTAAFDLIMHITYHESLFQPYFNREDINRIGYNELGFSPCQHLVWWIIISYM
jgi:hypothetical protein